MEAIYRTFPSNDAVSFHFVYKNTKQPRDELPDHMHDWYELVYVYQGKGTFFIDQTFYEMRAGDLFFIPPNVIHRAFPDPSDPVTSTAVFLSPKLAREDAEAPDAVPPLHCFALARTANKYRFPLSKRMRDVVASALEACDIELRDRRKGCTQLVRYGVLSLLIRLAWELEGGDSKPEPAPAHVPPWLKETLEYIDKHLQADLRLSALCKMAAVSPSHFSRTFRQTVGMTVTDYVVAKRIALAKNRLVHTEEQVQHIAYECGFESLPYFHKKFKTITGYTPMVYKRLHNAK